MEPSTCVRAAPILRNAGRKLRLIAALPELKVSDSGSLKSILVRPGLYLNLMLTDLFLEVLLDELSVFFEVLLLGAPDGIIRPRQARPSHLGFAVRVPSGSVISKLSAFTPRARFIDPEIALYLTTSISEKARSSTKKAMRRVTISAKVAIHCGAPAASFFLDRAIVALTHWLAGAAASCPGKYDMRSSSITRGFRPFLDGSDALDNEELIEALFIGTNGELIGDWERQEVGDDRTVKVVKSATAMAGPMAFGSFMSASI